MPESNQPAKWFKIVAILALVWNIFGVIAYFIEVSMTDEAVAALDATMREYYENRPTWAISAFAVAVWAGLLGSILLVMRKELAQPVLVISLVGLIAQNYYSFFKTDYFATIGYGAAVLAIVVLVFSAYLVWLSRYASNQGWMK